MYNNDVEGLRRAILIFLVWECCCRIIGMRQRQPANLAAAALGQRWASEVKPISTFR
jgi:hypothetical protein